MIPKKPRASVELSERDLRVLLEPAQGVAAGVDLIVAVAAVDAGPRLERCLSSIATQRGVADRCGVVLLLDRVRTTDTAVSVPQELAGRVWVVSARCGTASRARNALLEFIDIRVPTARWVARLDGDDRFASPDSLAAAVSLGDSSNASFVLGGNRVLSGDGGLLRENPVSEALLQPPELLGRLRTMADGTAVNELPSCNLLLRSRLGFRYPDSASAEDHWLVARLLFERASECAILPSPFFADYTLDGAVTVAARSAQEHERARRALAAAATTWFAGAQSDSSFLGLGQEGIVTRVGDQVLKHFYPGILQSSKVEWLSRTLRGVGPHLPEPEFRVRADDGGWVASYPWTETAPMGAVVEAEAVADFLRACLAHDLVCCNVKRDNFRINSDGTLQYVDIGNWIIPMDVSYLRDAAARLYAIGVLGRSDEDLMRRPTDLDRPEVWETLPGFEAFYRDVVSGHVHAEWSTAIALDDVEPAPRADVSLMIKACAMDAETAREQIVHIVEQLTEVAVFAERVLLIDPFDGPYVRQHTVGDLPRLIRIAEELEEAGVLDRVLLAPQDTASVREVNARWFGLDIAGDRTRLGVPVASQLWAFDQMETRFVLQCDVDVLVGRRAARHDYLSDMLAACAEPGVIGVAFNIPKHADAGPEPYGAPPGEYVPEVRCGLLDLQRIRAELPLPNDADDGLPVLTWYRSLQKRQREKGWRTLRGGDPSTFYVHPPNFRKQDPDELARVRDLVAQGIVPSGQIGCWDLEAPPQEWIYPRRSEPIVVVARGRDTPPGRLERFAAGLRIQEDQEFGVVVIDDASKRVRPSELTRRLAWLGSRLTLVRPRTRRGRMANQVSAIRELCTDADTLVVIVDLDDAVADRRVMGWLRDARERGHDVVLGAPFLPDRPTHVYAPDFRRTRETWGGDVWIHLRAFTKALFDALPDELLMHGGAWLDECTDYASMIPIVDIAKNPTFIPSFMYWHERTSRYEPEDVHRRDALIADLIRRDFV